MGTKCLRSVQFSSGSAQSIEPPIVWDGQRNSSRPPPAEIPARLGWSPGWMDDTLCWLCLLTSPGCYVVSDWRNFSSKSFTKSPFSSVRLPDRVDWQFVQFSSGHGSQEPPFSSFSSVHSVQFTNSSGPVWLHITWHEAISASRIEEWRCACVHNVINEND